MTSTSASPTVRVPLDLPAGAGRRRRVAAAALAGSLVAGAAVAGLAGFGGVTPAQADEGRPVRLRHCDATACLYAWAVVDSDGDGVSDADELVAGTDPHDAASTPSMRTVVELLETRQLPSFENGLATMVVMPAELVELREKATGEGRLEGLSFEGLDLPSRKDALSRLGISAETMKEVGVDPERGGFTLGLEPATKDDGLPSIRVGGIDVGLISADDSSKDHTPVTTAPPASAPAPTTPPSTDPPTTTKPDAGTDDDELVPLTPLEHGGIVDKKKIVNGTMYTYKDGTVRAEQSTGGVQYHPDGGVASTWTWDKNKKYVNPDADGGTIVDPAAFEAWERMLGSAERTIEGWRTPVADGEPTGPDRTLVALVDSDLAVGAFVVFDEPRVTSAQPEGRPDLPDPREAAPKGGSTGSGGDCGWSLCAG